MIQVRLGVLHESRLFRQCLSSVLDMDDQLTVVLDIDPASQDVLTTLTQASYDVLLLDADLPRPRTVDVIKHVRSGSDSKGIIVIFERSDIGKLAECVATGADACVAEDSSLDDLKVAIANASARRPYLPQKTMQSLLHRFFSVLREPSRREPVAEIVLTQREKEVLNCLSRGLSNKEIAKRLSISAYTVKCHVHNVLEKLGVGNRTSAAEYARRRDWLTPD